MDGNSSTKFKQRITCFCNKYIATGLPCQHAIACLLEITKSAPSNSEDKTIFSPLHLHWVHKIFWKSTFVDQYNVPMKNELVDLNNVKSNRSCLFYGDKPIGNK